ncbi:MAG: hypothetical protein JNJ45_12365 [Chthonomonas sp.]|nr:hypothetical protein [Chthonomonas sp.]
MRKLGALVLLVALVAGCKPPESVDEAADNVKTVNKKVTEIAGTLSEAAHKKAEEAEKFAAKIAADKELNAAAKSFIVATLADANGLVSAAATSPIESAMKNAPASSQWLRQQVANKVANSKGDAKVAWQLLLNRIDEKIKASKAK